MTPPGLHRCPHCTRLTQWAACPQHTTPAHLLRDFTCPSCGKGTSRVGRECLDCTARPTPQG